MPSRRKWPPSWRIDTHQHDILIIAGTRPECIKLAPIVRSLLEHPDFRVVVVNSGQHLEAVHRTFQEFGIYSDITLAPLPGHGSLVTDCEHLGGELSAVISRVAPALVVVQGDTLTAYAGARAGHQGGFKVAHVEAGLRTAELAQPFPEEWFRRRIAKYADIHFAPSRSAVSNLLAEGVSDDSIHHVGNTGIDSLCWILSELSREPRPEKPYDQVLVTLHRRENCGRNTDAVCDALIQLAAARENLRILFPVHPNPRIAAPVRKRLAHLAAFEIVEPMSYRNFVRNAAHASLIISDSGGIQEEAPHLGTPLLVPRRNTERPECIGTGFVRLVAADGHAIFCAAQEMLRAPRGLPVPIDDRAAFGGGDAAQKILGVLEAMTLERAYA